MEDCIHVARLTTCRSKASEKIFAFYIENAKLRCCCGAVDPSASQN